MKKNTFKTNVLLKFDGYRIDKFLQSQLKDLSRTRLQSLIKKGYVYLNDSEAKSSSKKIKTNDNIKVDTSTGQYLERVNS